MKDEKGFTESFFKKYRGVLTVIIIMITLLIVVSVIFYKGYSSAQEKSEQEIAALQAEIERLKEPAATYTEVTSEINISLINTDIQEIGELATIEYLYTDAGKFSDAKKLFGADVPFTTKTFIVKWDGSIKAGVKIEEVYAEVKEADKKIIVHIPKAEILSHEIDNKSFQTLDEKDGLFNPIEIDDIREFDAVSKDEMEKRAIENGILEKAFESAKGIIYKLVSTDVVEELRYTIEFEIIE